MINILIRTSYRPVSFKRLLDSIHSQTFKNIRIIVSYDDDRALNYIPEGIDKIRVHKSNKPFYYDEYVNNLKELVTDGWFVVIDDDDTLIDSGVLERVYKHLLDSNGIIVQFSRSGQPKPSNEQIKNKEICRGKIGMPCLFLHHSHKNIADLDGSVGASDFTWIKRVSRKVKLRFVPIVVAYSGKRGNGQMEA